MDQSRPSSSPLEHRGPYPGSRERDPGSAWKELYENMDIREPRNTPKPHEEADPPVAMEAETLDNNGQVRIRQRMEKNMVEKTGCWYGFWRGVRGIWLTTETEDIDYNSRRRLKVTLRELIVYLLFLIDICVLAYSRSSPQSYYFTRSMRSLFVDASDPNSTTLRDMDDADKFWKYAKGPLLNGLYWEEGHAMNTVTNHTGYVYYENKLIGLPRLRMLRVKPDTCNVPATMRDRIGHCYGSYSEGNEDRQQFGQANSDPWTFKTEKELNGSVYYGAVSNYGGGGFTALLGRTRDQASTIISNLEKNMWIDRATRVVFIDFTVYNGNINLFCLVKLLVEFPSVGGAIPSWSFRTVNLIRYWTAFDQVILGLQGLFCAFVLYYLIEETIEIARNQCRYFRSLWNVMDLLVIQASLSCIGLALYRDLFVSNSSIDQLNKTDSYVEFDSPASAELYFDYSFSVMAFLAWIKILKYFRFTESLDRLTYTITRCSPDLFGLCILFFILIFAYAQFGYLVFGTQIRSFSTLYDSLFTCLAILVGDFDYYELVMINGVLGPVFLVTFVLFMLVFTGIVVAVISDTYSRVKVDLDTQQAVYIGDYLKRGTCGSVNRVQSVEHITDVNQWRSELRKRGFTDDQVAAMLMRYNLDNDHGMDHSDRRRSSVGNEMQRHYAMDMQLVSRRVDHIEECINSISRKLDTVLIRLEDTPMQSNGVAGTKTERKNNDSANYSSSSTISDHRSETR